jgi:hypothetical protein
METQIKNSSLYQRLRELRVDFAYSKNLFFAATERVKKEGAGFKKTKKILEISSIIISVFTLSSVAVYFSQKCQTTSVIIIGFLSIISIGISIYLLTLDNKYPWEEYSRTASSYQDLYKKAKIMESEVEDNIIGMVDLNKKVDELIYLQSKLTNVILTTTDEDMKKAKENISTGRNTYTEDDFQNT